MAIGSPGEHSGSLLERLAGGRTRAAITFAGQGADVLPGLAALLDRRPELDDQIDAVVEVLAALAASPKGQASGRFRYGVDVRAWVDDPDGAPPAAYLRSCAVSYPLVLLAQLLAWNDLWALGFGDALPRAAGHAPVSPLVAVTGHSSGLLAALAVAEAPLGPVEGDRLARWIEIAFRTGLHLAPVAAAVPAGPDDAGPMAAVSGVRLGQLTAIVGEVNVSLADPAQGVVVALVNAPDRHVVSGAPASLDVLRSRLDDIAAAHERDRAAGRPPAVPLRHRWETLAVDVPFHWPGLAPAAARHEAWLAASGLLPRPADLALPVLSPVDGTDLRRLADGAGGVGGRGTLAGVVAASQLVEPVRWDRTVARLVAGGAGWILDLGPGVEVARLTGRNVRGLGPRVLPLASPEGLRILATPGAAPTTPDVRYADLAPRLGELPGGRSRLDNRYTRATGQPPVVLPGMTPTTADAPIVAAAANAGFTAELAGGGQPTPWIFHERLAELRDLLDPGAGIVLNSLYLDRPLWSLQVGDPAAGTDGLLFAAKRAGAPFVGLTVSAGVPEADEAVALLDRLRAAGMVHNAFKPGTVDQIRQVLAIADAAPQHTVAVHVEGGRAGGHHSYEDLDELLLATYHDLRVRPNVVVCAGGGVGTPERAAELLTGRWSERYGEPAMPVDAVLVGTAAMACAEAAASPQVKAALVDLAGSPAWVPRGGTAGGVHSGRSSLNADIHVAGNAAARAAALLASVAGDATAVAARHDEIVEALAATAKPWFGDLPAMTYGEVLERFTELCAVGRGGRYDDGRWGDPTWRARALALYWRFAARLADPAARALSVDTTPDPRPEPAGATRATLPGGRLGAGSGAASPLGVEPAGDRRPDATGSRAAPGGTRDGGGGSDSPAGPVSAGRVSPGSTPHDLDDPAGALAAFRTAFPAADTTLLHPADALAFVEVCDQPGKPVPFVPVLDAEVRRWFMADALWQAQDDRYPADAVFALPGPAAVAGITQAGEPVADLLARFEQATVDELVAAGVEVVARDRRADGGMAPAPFAALARGRSGPLAALCSAPLVVTGGGAAVPNPLWTLVVPADDVTTEVAAGDRLVRIAAQPAEHVQLAEHGGSTDRVVAEEAGPSRVDVTVTMAGRDLVLRFEVTGGTVREVAGTAARIAFHRSALALAAASAPIPAPDSSAGDRSDRGPSVATGAGGRVVPVGGEGSVPPAAGGAVPDRAALVGHVVERGWCCAGETVAAYRAATGARHTGVPVDLAFSLAWPALVALLTGVPPDPPDPPAPAERAPLAGVPAQLGALVHHAHRVVTGPAWPPVAGEQGTAAARVTGVRNAAQERHVDVRIELASSRGELAVVEAGLLVRRPPPPGVPVRHAARHHVREIVVAGPAEQELLAGHEAITVRAGTAIAAGDRLRFEVETASTWPGGDRPAQHRALGRIHRATRAALADPTDPADPAEGGWVVVADVGLDRAGTEAVNPVDALVEVLAPEPDRRQERPRSELAHAEDTAPADMGAFARIGGDHNPLHRSVLAARMAGLDRPAVHGMWTAARAAAFVVDQVCDGAAGRLLDWAVRFTAPVPLGAELRFTATRSAVDGGRWRVEVVVRLDDGTDGADGTVVAMATAVVAPPVTALVFPGQGTQRPGLGADDRTRSRAAREVWERADAHTRSHQGWSLLEVLERSPGELRMADGTTLRHPRGVLHRTELTQVVLVAQAAAQLADLRATGAVPGAAAPGIVAAGHSVGEYSALLALGVLPLEAALDLVHQRGRAMQAVVARDAAGGSQLRLAAVDPARAGLDAGELVDLVVAVAASTGALAEVVNHNAAGRQYVVAGTVGALAELAARLERSGDRGSAPALRWLDGIDVPFHSSALLPAVAALRPHLERLVGPVDHRRLVGRWVPNLVGRPFGLDPGFVADVARVTGVVDIAGGTASARYPVVDDRSGHLPPGSRDDPDAVARVLLIELLAHQLARPVRWIDVQDALLAPVTVGGLGARRQVEVGPAHAPILTDLACLVPRPPTVELLHVHHDRERVVFAEVPEPTGDDDGDGGDDRDDGAGEHGEDEVPASHGTPPRPVAEAHTTGSAPVEDRAPAAGEALRMVLALQARVRLDQLRDDETLDELFQGVSSRRNQVLIDLGRELDLAGTDGVLDRPLAALTNDVGDRTARYRFPGTYLRATIATGLTRALGRAGLARREAQAHLAGAWGLGPGLAEHVLVAIVLETRPGTSARGGPLGRWAGDLPTTPDGGRRLLDRAVEQVARQRGIDLRPLSQARAGNGAADEAAVRRAGERIEGALVGAAHRLLTALDRPWPADGDLVVPETAHVGEAADADTDADVLGGHERLAVLDRELGADRAAAVAGRFDHRRNVRFTTPPARWDLVTLYHDALDRRRSAADLRAECERLALHGGDPAFAATVAWFTARARNAGRSDVADLLAALTPARGTPLVPPAVRPTTRVGADGRLTTHDVPDHADHPGRPSGEDPVVPGGGGPPGRLGELIEGLERQVAGAPVQLADRAAARAYAAALRRSLVTAPSFTGTVALVTGAGPGSIAAELVRHLLRGGATVVVTTSTPTLERRRWWREQYRTAAAPGAELHLVPANLASFADIDALVRWLADPVTPHPHRTDLANPPLVPDLVVPFAAVPSTGDAPDLGAGSETALRVQLLGVERLVGRVAELAGGRAGTTPVTVLLPLSPNHGDFGGDGAYGEAKAALEVLGRRARSERAGWGRSARVVGARIGWVRGTGLMRGNDLLAPLVEERLGVRTFSAAEMGWLLATACSLALGRDRADRLSASSSPDGPARPCLPVAGAGGPGSVGPAGPASAAADGRLRSGDPAGVPAGSFPDQIDLTGGLGDLADLRAALEPLAAELADRAAVQRRRHELAQALSRRLWPDGPPAEPPRSDAADAPMPPPNEPYAVRPSGEPGRTGAGPPAASAVPNDVPAGVGGQQFGGERVDPRDMVVIVGTGELGPCGTALSRFALELADPGELGEPLPDAAVVELAWLCGLATFQRDGYRGRWVDGATGLAVDESELADRYRTEVLARVGLRPLEDDGVIDPEGDEVLTTVHLDHDVTFEVDDEATARSFLAADPAHTEVRRHTSCGEGDGRGAGGTAADRGTTWTVIRKAGAPIRVPRRVARTRRVAGQLPAGLDLARFGIAPDLLVTADRMALVNLACTAEAFRQAGVEPEELLAAVHPAEVANTQGAGMGGMASVRHLLHDQLLDHERQGDRLQESLGNVVAAHVVQGYVGSYGPMVHPVAACATAAVSLEEAARLIGAGRTRAVVAGGYDDLTPEGMVGFGDMHATAASDDLDALGLEPVESSRANDVRRRGFVESQGGGALLVVRGDLALELGLPVQGVLVYAGSFGDGIHTSIPAPGMGVLAAASGGPDSPLATALCRHGLDADDIAVVSKHDTSTELNDPNEADLHERLQRALGRTPGNPLLVVSQKTVTGHAKGGAAAWQVAGVLQMMATGWVPGNRNLDQLDPAVGGRDRQGHAHHGYDYVGDDRLGDDRLGDGDQDHGHLVHGHRALRCAVGSGEPVRAALVTSLGFGHVSALLALAHPGTFVAGLPAGERAGYLRRSAARRAEGERRRLAVRYGMAPPLRRTDRRLGPPPTGPTADRSRPAARTPALGPQPVAAPPPAAPASRSGSRTGEPLPGGAGAPDVDRSPGDAIAASGVVGLDGATGGTRGPAPGAGDPVSRREAEAEAAALLDPTTRLGPDGVLRPGTASSPPGASGGPPDRRGPPPAPAVDSAVDG